jgi:hypothetical protein
MSTPTTTPSPADSRWVEVQPTADLAWLGHKLTAAALAGDQVRIGITEDGRLQLTVGASDLVHEWRPSPTSAVAIDYYRPTLEQDTPGGLPVRELAGLLAVGDPTAPGQVYVANPGAEPGDVLRDVVRVEVDDDGDLVLHQRAARG